jgi:hypothetical protein
MSVLGFDVAETAPAIARANDDERGIDVEFVEADAFQLEDFGTPVPRPARIQSVRTSRELRSTPAPTGTSPPSNRTGFRRDSRTTAHRPGSQRSNGSESAIVQHRKAA